MKKPINRYVLTDEIYHLVKEQILDHRIAPGDKINIDQLARDYEVSNIPIREALSRLATEGFVTTVPFKGMFAAMMSVQEIDEIFEIRMELEELAIRKAIGRIPEQALRKLEQQMMSAGDEQPTEAAAKMAWISAMNAQLHGLVLAYCDNVSLQRLISMYIEKIERYLSHTRCELDQSLLQAEWEEHRQVVSALMDGNEELAAQMLVAHLRQSHRRTRYYFQDWGKT